jgi:large subunit ribosomal protein L5
MATGAQRSRLKDRYEQEIRPALIERFQYTTPMQAPVIRKITLNMGVGDAKQDSKVLEAATEQLATIAGQRPSVRRARKSIAAFKLREGMPVGVSVTLRGERSYEFLDRLMSIAIPRIRDFRGMNPRSFDGRGNYSMGVREQIIFPEIDYDAIDQTRGMDITITTSARTDAEAFALLEAFGFPFARPEGAEAPGAAAAIRREEAAAAKASDEAAEEAAAEERLEGIAEELAEEIAEEIVAEELIEEAVEEIVAERLVEEAAEDIVAEELVEEISEEIAAAESGHTSGETDASAEEAAEEVAAEELIEKVAEELAAEAIVEEIAEEIAAEALVEEVAEEIAAEALVEEVAEEIAASADAAAASGEDLDQDEAPGADQATAESDTDEPKDQE